MPASSNLSKFSILFCTRNDKEIHGLSAGKVGVTRWGPGLTPPRLETKVG